MSKFDLNSIQPTKKEMILRVIHNHMNSSIKMFLKDIENQDKIMYEEFLNITFNEVLEFNKKEIERSEILQNDSLIHGTNCKTIIHKKISYKGKYFQVLIDENGLNTIHDLDNKKLLVEKTNKPYEDVIKNYTNIEKTKENLEILISNYNELLLS